VALQGGGQAGAATGSRYESLDADTGQRGHQQGRSGHEYGHGRSSSSRAQTRRRPKIEGNNLSSFCIAVCLSAFQNLASVVASLLAVS